MPPKAKPDNTAMRALKQTLKNGTPKGLYVFYGEEAYLREYYFTALKQSILPAGLEEFNYHTIQSKDCSPEWLAQAVDCLPVMSQHTLVAVTDFDLSALGEQQQRRLIQVLSDLPDYCCLVFTYDLLPYKVDRRSKLAAVLKEQGTVVNFQRQDQGDLTDWICRRFKATGHSIDTEDARYLIFLCGDLMNNLTGEIGKIAAYASHPRVTREDIDQVAIPVIEAVVFQMTDAIARRDFDRAASVLADLLHSQEPPIMILAVIGKYFRQLYTARLYLERGKNRGDLMALWAMKSTYPADKLLATARQFPLSWCRYGMRRCWETERSLKTSYGQEAELLVSLLIELSASSGEVE